MVGNVGYPRPHASKRGFSVERVPRGGLAAAPAQPGRLGGAGLILDGFLGGGLHATRKIPITFGSQKVSIV